jgi:phosphotriesterase-related protein
MGATIQTARGDAVTSNALGVTLMHEHTFNLSPEINQNYPETWGNEESRVAKAIADYRELKAAGVDTIVDVTVIGLGRFIPRIKRIAESVDLNIVVATGVYIWQALPMFFAARGPNTDGGGPDTMDDLFVRDIEEGIAGTNVRAGILKVATDKYGLTPGVDRVLRATAKAHRRTGVPITTHTHDVPNGLQQQQVFREEGVDLSRIVIGHMDLASTHALDYIEEVLAAGSFIGIDQFGVPTLTDEVRMDAVAELVRRGHAGRIVLSHDHNSYCDMVPKEWFDAVPNWRKTFIVQEVVPGLLSRGVTREQIDQMLIHNPRRIFEKTALGPY